MTLRKVDHNGLRTGTGTTIILLVIAFVLDSPLLVGFVGLCQLLGALDLPFAPYRLLYQRILRPAGLVQPNIIDDNPEPHRFSMLLGALFNGIGASLLFAGLGGTGWLFVGIVLVLANLNFWLDFCAGCWMYYQLNRLGIRGFTATPVKGR